MLPANFTLDNIPDGVLIGFGGGVLVLLQSILSGTRRVWWRLLLSCLLGAGGAALAGHIFSESRWVYPICGAAAIMSENIILGLFQASEDFRKEPIRVFSELWQLVVPDVFKAKQMKKDSEPAG
jgi:hypothetical protein